MSDVSMFFPVRGCYYKITGNNSPSFYNVNPEINAECPIMYNSVDIRGVDHVAKTLCFNGIRDAAVVSKDFGQVVVGGIALLGAVTSTAAFGSAFMSMVNDGRVYNKVATCKVSSQHGGAHQFLLENYNLGHIDPQFNIQSFSFGGALLD